MIAAWMLYATAVGAVLLAGSAGLARLARGAGQAERGVWSVAIVAAIVIPAVQPLVRSMGTRPGPEPTALPLPDGAPFLPALLPAGDAAALLSLDRLFLTGWLLWSGLGFVRFVRGQRRLQGATGTRGEALGGPLHGGRLVCWTAELGPAVAGIVRPRILLPAWLRRAPPELRRWVLRHETEHLRAGDLSLHTLAHLARIALPWNLALRLLARGLRRALETDCDRRVLSRTRAGGAPGAAVRGYGEALLAVAGRSSAAGAALGTFDRRTHSLHHRIATMTTPSAPLTRTRLASGLGLALATLFAACDLPSPPIGDDTPPVSDDAPPAAATFEGRDAAENGPAPEFTPFTVAPKLANPDEVRAALEREYPPLLRDAGIGGTVKVWFRIDEQGRVRATRIAESSGHDALDAAARRVGEAMVFEPAVDDDKKVAVWVAFPLIFRTPDADASGA
jgi:TonB family protein